MDSSSLVSLEQYLRTTYRPDRDFVEGEARARHLGERPHAVVHAHLVWRLGQLENLSGYHVLASPRIQVRAHRVRVPDLCLAATMTRKKRVLSAPPFLCVEVFSSNESLSSMEERVADYAGMGVDHIWAADPWNRKGYQFRNGKLEEPAEGVLRIAGTPIRVSLASMFKRLDP